MDISRLLQRPLSPVSSPWTLNSPVPELIAVNLTDLADIPTYTGPLYHEPFPPGHPLAYDEKTFLRLWNKILDIWVLQSYIEPREVLQPPPGGHVLDESIVAGLDLSPAAASLIRHMPYWKGRDRKMFVENQCQPYEILHSREEFLQFRIILDGDDLSRDTIALPQDVALGRKDYYDSVTWILDTEANAIREFELENSLAKYELEFPGFALEFPERSYYYRNSPPRHAYTFLLSYLNKLINLELIAFGFDVSPLYDADPQEVIASMPWAYMKRKLQEYGWPNEFRAADWARDYKRIDDEAFKSNNGP